MEIQDVKRDIRGFSLTTVQFAAETRQEKRYAVRMNRFYRELEKTAEQYAASCLENSPLAWYNCTVQACRQGEWTEVTVVLSRRIPGAVSGRKCVLHRWRDGVLREEKYL